MKKQIILLTLIIFLAGFLRFYRLGEVPIGVHRDEAFLGYNAYSILKTGKDINNVTLPIHLKSFLYSPAGYSYASIPFIALFGLNALSIRFASALAGTATVFLTYFLVGELFSYNGYNRYKHYNDYIGLLSALLLAISPWHLNLSRTATENTLVVFVITFGTLLYLRWHKNNQPVLLVGSFISFFVTLFIYQAPRAFLPLFIPILIWLYRHPDQARRARGGISARFLSFARNDILPLVLFVLTILLPLILIFRSPNLSLRLNTVSIFSNAETQLSLDESLREDGVSQQPRIIARLFHNKPVAYTQQFLQNYFSHFSYPFLFTDKGLPDRYRIPGQGLLYLVELPLLLIGLYSLFKDRRPYSWLLLSWVLTAPIGSSIAFDDVPNLQRTLLIFPALSITMALGIMTIHAWVKGRKNLFIGLLGYWLIGLFYIYNVVSYLHSYYIHQPIHQPWRRHEGYQELVAKVNSLLPQYQQAVVTDRQSAPTIFFLFFGKYDPAKFQEDTSTSTFPDYDRIAFANYEFSQQECPLRVDENGAITGKPGILYVNFVTCKTPDQTKELGLIRRGDSSIVFQILTP